MTTRTGPMDPELRGRAKATRGFMPSDEGLALYEAACDLSVPGPLLEVGSYCGKSSVYLGAAAREQGRLLFALDHPCGSEENQPGWEWHEADLVDPAVGKMDTLPHFRHTIHDAGPGSDGGGGGGCSRPRWPTPWATPLAFLFIDGGHGVEPARLDGSELWTPHVTEGGTLAIHDVFPDPADGGRPPSRAGLPARAGQRAVRGAEGGGVAAGAAPGQSRSVTCSASSASNSSGSSSSWRVNRPAGGRAAGEGVRRQDHGRRRVGRALARGEAALVGEHRARPVAAVLVAVALGPAEQVAGHILVSPRPGWPWRTRRSRRR